jgi:hypothetical protein
MSPKSNIRLPPFPQKTVFVSEIRFAVDEKVIISWTSPKGYYASISAATTTPKKTNFGA